MGEIPPSTRNHVTYVTHGELYGTYTWRCHACGAYGGLWFDVKLAQYEADDHTADMIRKAIFAVKSA